MESVFRWLAKMRSLKLTVVVLVVWAMIGCGSKPSPPPPLPTPQSSVSVPVPGSPTPTPTPLVQPCASAGDVTPAILASSGTHSGGGCIRTQLVVSGSLSLNGVYQVVDPILIKSGGSITGAGWETVIIESAKEGEFTVFSAYNHARQNGATDSNISIKNLKIAGANPGFNSAPQAVSLGNCVGCLVDNLWLDRTRSIGIQLGGGDTFYSPTGPEHYYAKDSKIINCLLTHVASQAIALVNGENIEISGNRILRPGQAGGPGASSIDLEVNSGDDRLVNVRITNNFIDHQNAEMDTTGNGIIVNSGDAGLVSNVLVDSNVIIGGSVNEPVTNVLSNGIFVFGALMQGVTITNNKITRTGQSGIRLQGSNLICEDNTLISVGGGGILGFVANVNNTRLQRNSLVCMAGPCDNTMKVEGTGNTVRDNPGWKVE